MRLLSDALAQCQRFVDGKAATSERAKPTEQTQTQVGTSRQSHTQRHATVAASESNSQRKFAASAAIQINTQSNRSTGFNCTNNDTVAMSLAKNNAVSIV